MTVQCHKPSAVLLNELQKQHREIAELKTLRAENTDLKARLERLERMIGS